MADDATEDGMVERIDYLVERARECAGRVPT
jgi:hypothetical protein